jgi:hypothetical protein
MLQRIDAPLRHPSLRTELEKQSWCSGQTQLERFLAEEDSMTVIDENAARYRGIVDP